MEWNKEDLKIVFRVKVVTYYFTFCTVQLKTNKYRYRLRHFDARTFDVAPSETFFRSAEKVFALLPKSRR